ncbi:DgyrCDS5424 [Dimorphilus gyrociliatus]|uniref:DgyrCDS5424 n=1 Tax=Dimorphilus gyrociliatus TaxID=2664684 RepID=A0A7I8VJT7_9ANNE|nr:DgyrCDS5424 [Dimorphilus gyrociliatus]
MSAKIASTESYNKQVHVEDENICTKKNVSQTKKSSDTKNFSIPKLSFGSLNVLAKPLQTSKFRSVSKIMKKDKNYTMLESSPQKVVETQKSLARKNDEEVENALQMEDDTYEDVIPKSERITSYLKDIISWKPSVYRRMDSQTELEHMESPNLPFFDTSPPSPIPTEEAKEKNEISWDFEWSS